MPDQIASPSQQPPVLDVRHVAKAYGRHRVLRDISLVVERGHVAAVTGENGSGKSTLLSVIAGGLKADSGTVIHTGRIGYCPQEGLVFEGLTVEENLLYFATGYGLHLRDGHWRAKAEELLERFRFGSCLRTPVSRLSGGTRQKLNLIIAFLHSPELLVLDEPYSGFDWESYVRFWEYAKELRAQGRSILVVAHLIYDRSQLDSLYTLAEGVLRCA